MLESRKANYLKMIAATMKPPARPDQPAEPIQPVQPAQPVQTSQLEQQAKPVQPVQPVVQTIQRTSSIRSPPQTKKLHSSIPTVSNGISHHIINSHSSVSDNRNIHHL